MLKKYLNEEWNWAILIFMNAKCLLEADGYLETTTYLFNDKGIDPLTGDKKTIPIYHQIESIDIQHPLAYKQIQPKLITGIDISEGMMRYGAIKIEQKGLQQKIKLQLADSTNIPFDDHNFDGAMVAFGVRNFADLEKGLKEIHRVLIPGSKLVILEFSKPTNFWFKPIYNFYMKWLTPTIGNIFSGNKEAYAYLNESVMAFPEGAAFLTILEQAGFKNVSQEKLSLGICSIYCANKL